MENHELHYDWKEISSILGVAGFLTVIIYTIIQM